MLPDVVLEVLLATLVGDLSQPGLLARECLVQVKQLQLGGFASLPEIFQKHQLANPAGSWKASTLGH